MKTLTTTKCCILGCYGWDHSVIGERIFFDVTSPYSGEVIIKKNQIVTEETLENFIEEGIDTIHCFD